MDIRKSIPSDNKRAVLVPFLCFANDIWINRVNNMPGQNPSSSQYVVFKLCDDHFALPVEQVVQALRMVAITAIPEGPDWLAGVINLRGVVVPVIDLRLRLGLPYQAPDLNTPIIILDAPEHWVGFTADSTEGVLSITEDAITTPDELTIQARAVKAIARTENGLVLILNLEHLTNACQNLELQDFLKELHEIPEYSE